MTINKRKAGRTAMITSPNFHTLMAIFELLPLAYSQGSQLDLAHH